MSDTKYTFKVVVELAQICTLTGRGQSAPDKFPEFRKKNQLDMPDDADDKDKTKDKDKDKDKKAVLDPITNFHPPVAAPTSRSCGNRSTEPSLGCAQAAAQDCCA